ncbi:MAG: hypothetical protein R2845_14595 [Thermomicrobiales bacterium]
MLFSIFLTMIYLATNQPGYVVLGLTAFGDRRGVALYQTFDRIGIRVQNWLDPWADPLASGNQPIQSDFSIALRRCSAPGSRRPAVAHPGRSHRLHLSAIAEELGRCSARSPRSSCSC